MSDKNVNRKGITPVIAIVLLLMMTVAAAGLAYEFIMDMSAKQTEAIGEQVSAQSDKMRTNLQILQVQNGSGNLTFMIKNVGSLAVGKIVEGDINVKVDGEMITPDSVGGDCTGSSLEVKSTCDLMIEHGYMDLPAVGETTTFEIILGNGYVLAYGCNRASSTDAFC